MRLLAPLLLALTAPPHEAGPRPAQSGSARAEAVVRALHPGPEGARERLERLEPRPVELLLELGLSGAVPEGWSSLRSGPLLPREREAVLAVLASTRFRLLQPALAELAAAPTPWIERALAMTLLENAVQPEAVHLLIALATHPAETPAPAQARTTYGRVLARLVANDPGNLAALRPVLAAVPPELFTTTLAALDGAPDELLLELVVVSLGRDGALDPLLLAYAARYAARARPPFDPEVRARARAFLHHADARLQAAAAGVAGHLGDEAAVGDLVDLLASSDPAVVRAAHGALQEITGLRFAARPEAWERWVAAEQRWWQERSAEELSRLRSASDAEALAALRALASHRLHRGPLAAELALLLRELSERRALVACELLADLGAAEALPGLWETATEHPSRAVRERAGAACAALRAATRPPAAGARR